jgi:hypothetical protein
LLFSFENLYRQYLKCRCNKRNTVNALRFEARQEENLLELLDALQSRTYHPGCSVCFVTLRPKMREIFAADFRDRVVHHVLVDYLDRLWEPVFIHDSYACRKKKGVHAGVNRLRQFIRQVTRNGRNRAWYLQLDIRNYFMSIDKSILFERVARRIDDPNALWLTQVLVFHDCTENYVMKGDPALLKALPPHKTLFGCAAGKGLPIGNLNSQFFANVYLDALDQFVKHELKCRHYLRYCDDFVLLSTDREQLLEWKACIATFLRERLLLELNPKRERLRPVADGVDFLGYVVRGDYMLARHRVVGHFREKLRQFEKLLVRDAPGYRCYRYDRAEVDRMAAVLASYMGHFGHADCYRLVQGLWQEFQFLGQYFHRHDDGIVRKDKVPVDVRGVAHQYRYYRHLFPGDVILFQVGRFMEFYQPGDAEVAQRLGLAPMQKNRRGARWGMPLGHSGKAIRRLLKEGRSVVLVRESEQNLEWVRERVPIYRFEVQKAF